MPRTTPITDELRQQIGDDIAVGHGRNELARRYKVSPGLVSKIARERGLGFRNTWMVDVAVPARQIDLFAKRVERMDELLDEYLALPKTTRPDGKRTKREKRLSYAIYNLDRHHNGTYRT